MHSETSLQSSLNKLTSGKLLQNIPNPCNSTTDIYYRIFNAHDAVLTINNNLGILCQKINLGVLSDGIHKETVDTKQMGPGIYVYSLTVNGKKTDTKKMVVLR
jgi:hypothetical protein